MTAFWVVLLLLQQGHALTPVVSVHLGKPVTLSCLLPKTAMTHREVFWYRQRAGETLTLIAELQKPAKPEFSGEISDSRINISQGDELCNMTILETTLQDEGMYHCEVKTWLEKPVWTGTYVVVKGNTERTSNYSVVQASTASDPVRPGDSVTLQCSVVSDPDHQTCPGRLSVYWFRAGSDASHPGVIYADGTSKCEQRSESVKSCRHRFSTVSSSDAGTYHCAVATCGQILFGEGTKVQIEQNVNYGLMSVGILICICLAVSLAANIVFICYRKPMCQQGKGKDTQARRNNSSHLLHDIAEGEQDLNYAALHFSGAKAKGGRNKKDLNTEESVYAQVKS